MTTHEQMHPTNGSKPQPIRRSNVRNIRILYRHHKKIVSTFFVLIAFLMAFSESYSQQDTIHYNPKYNVCINYPEYDYTCDPDFDRVTEIVNDGFCKVEVTYLVKRCTYNNSYFFYKVEIENFRVIVHPYCYGLIDNLIYPDGNINDIESRKLLIRLYQQLSDRYFKPLALGMSSSMRTNYYCDSTGRPVNAPDFFQALEGSCMAFCKTKGTSTFVSTNPFEVTPNPNTSYFWHNFQTLKCSEACCYMYIWYCYDPITEKWRRTTVIDTYGGSSICNEETTPITQCRPPFRIIFGSPNVAIAGEISTLIPNEVVYSPCEQTCQFYDGEQGSARTAQLNW